MAPPPKRASSLSSFAVAFNVLAKENPRIHLGGYLRSAVVTATPVLIRRSKHRDATHAILVDSGPSTPCTSMRLFGNVSGVEKLYWPRAALKTNASWG